MKRQAILIFSHELTAEQERELREKWCVTDIATMPEDISKRWKNVPPDLPSLKEYVRPLLEWLVKVALPGDLVLVQGDFGATYITVNFAMKIGLVPVYATTSRQVKERNMPGGVVEQSRIFSHRMFRKYEA